MEMTVAEDGALGAMLEALRGGGSELGSKRRRSQGVCGLRWRDPFDDVSRKLAELGLIFRSDSDAAIPGCRESFFSAGDWMPSASINFYRDEMNHATLFFVFPGSQDEPHDVRLALEQLLGPPDRTDGAEVEMTTWFLFDAHVAVYSMYSEPEGAPERACWVTTMHAFSLPGMDRERYWKDMPDPCGVEGLRWGMSFVSAAAELRRRGWGGPMRVPAESPLPGDTMYVFERERDSKSIYTMLRDDSLYRAALRRAYPGRSPDDPPGAERSSLIREFGHPDEVGEDEDAPIDVWHVHDTEIRFERLFDDEDDEWACVTTYESKSAIAAIMETFMKMEEDRGR